MIEATKLAGGDTTNRKDASGAPLKREAMEGSVTKLTAPCLPGAQIVTVTPDGRVTLSPTAPEPEG